LEQVVSRLPDWMRLHPSTLAKVERGERDVTAQELYEISKALESTIDQVSAEGVRLMNASSPFGGGAL
jgi:transcriptional regulator with XRE-family HTH domain